MEAARTQDRIQPHPYLGHDIWHHDKDKGSQVSAWLEEFT